MRDVLRPRAPLAPLLAVLSLSSACAAESRSHASLPAGVWIDLAPEVTAGACALPPAPAAVVVRSGNTLDGAGVAELTLPPYTALAVDGENAAADGIVWLDGPREEDGTIVGKEQQEGCTASFRAAPVADLPDQDPGEVDGLWLVDDRLMRLSTIEGGAVLVPEAGGIALDGALVGTRKGGGIEVARIDVETYGDGNPYLTTTTTVALQLAEGSGTGTWTTALDWASEEFGEDESTTVDVRAERLDVDLGAR